ncbi:MAG: 5-formyltetrahydrofolate cyclo-ligase [Oscillospiraceae bacterium]|jgi:5-formyltetrahydrofolate cyclo-ligase|nr:5-formyltetrahydrofolate cyclo-ligase [Oscillospiraceae bacterium]
MKKFKLCLNELGEKSSLSELKKAIRKTMKEARVNIIPQEKANMEIAITERLAATKEYKESTIVLCYYSNTEEVSTRKLLERAWEDNKIVGIPKCDKMTQTMAFFAINSYQDIQTNENGFGEPDGKVLLSDFKRSICIVPALVFDYRGCRIGYGTGYYDKFLATYPGTKIGISFSQFMQRIVPKERHDIKMDYIITEKFTKQTGTR